MSKRKKQHIPNLVATLSDYADARELVLLDFSNYHMRLVDEGYTILDLWTTGRYYVVATDYNEKYPGSPLIERQGEKGSLPLEMTELHAFLDKLFFGEDMAEHIA
jgi:hypothetical protein